MKKRFKTVVTTAMVAALTASLLTGCGSSTNDTTASAPETGEASDTAEASGGSDGDSDSILIAGIAPLTGSLASWGEGAINGYNLAIKEINEAAASQSETKPIHWNQRYLRMISQMRLKRSAHTTTVHPMISVQSSVPALPAVPFPL